MKKRNEINSQKQIRNFSESFKRQRVEEYQNHLVTVHEISKAYQVTTTAIYNWIKKYSNALPAGTRQVIELESEARRTLELSKRNEELEKIVGRKQLQIEFLETILKVAGKELKMDLKKNFTGKP